MNFKEKIITVLNLHGAAIKKNADDDDIIRALAAILEKGMILENFRDAAEHLILTTNKNLFNSENKEKQQ